MREILFRAWDKVSKKYRNFDGMHDTLTINKDGKVEYYNLQNGSGGDEYILEQFTGFTDKNGKRIFEGDILHIEDDDGNKYVTEVWYERGGLVIDVKGCDYDYTVIGWLDYYYSMEIIGNIHDNPELMEQA